MSEEEPRTPDPAANADSGVNPAFLNMSPEIIDLVFPDGVDAPVAADFSKPNFKANKPKWWQRGKRINESDNPRGPKPKKPMPSMAPSALRQGLIDFYQGVAIVAMPFKPQLAMSISAQAEACADAWIELSKTNPAIKRFLIGLVTTSATGALIMAHAPILIAAAMAFVPAFAERDDAVSMAAFMSQMNMPGSEDK